MILANQVVRRTRIAALEGKITGFTISDDILLEDPMVRAMFYINQFLSVLN